MASFGVSPHRLPAPAADPTDDALIGRRAPSCQPQAPVRALVTVTLLIAAIIHLLPLVGAFGEGRLRALYGVEGLDPTMVILLRHRAVLFGLLGVYLAAAAFLPTQQPAAFGAGFVSVLSFLFVARAYRTLTPPIARVFRADLVALGALIAGALGLAAQR